MGAASTEALLEDSMPQSLQRSFDLSQGKICPNYPSHLLHQPLCVNPNLGAVLRFALKVAVGVLATIGVLFIVLEAFALLFAPHCMLNSAAQATSPTGQYFAVYEHRVCQKPENSRSEVLMGKRGLREGMGTYMLWMRQGVGVVALTGAGYQQRTR